MRLARFIRENLENILQEWEDFARQIHPKTHIANTVELRDHAAEMLLAIAADLELPQTEQQSIAKSHGLVPRASGETAAETHAAERLASGFTIDQLIAEYRALRASVLRLWEHRVKTTDEFETQDMTRFNEAIDQALSESVAHYSKITEDSTNLFLAILGHDVRTPLGAINMGAHVLLLDDGLSSKHLKVASRILNSAERLEDIVHDLLDFAATRSGAGIPIAPGSMDLGETANDVVEEMRTVHAERTVLFERHGDLHGNWDKVRIGQALSNLLGNALQHGSQTDPVTLTITGNEDNAVCTVHNRGNVIPPATLQTLFDPVKRYALRPVRGSSNIMRLGLGLYITSEIIRVHRGKISVASTEKDGTTFTVQLPKR